jgi:hypothetical protein
MGQTFTTILSNQFSRLENGDRFFYLNESWTTAEQAMLQQGNSLAKIIEANTNITNLQADVFKFTASISGTVSLQDGHSFGQGLTGITVQLQDTSGDVLAVSPAAVQRGWGHPDRERVVRTVRGSRAAPSCVGRGVDLFSVGVASECSLGTKRRPFSPISGGCPNPLGQPPVHHLRVTRPNAERLYRCVSLPA